MDKNLKTTMIISGFPGVGKTYYYKESFRNISIIDSDSSKFSHATYGPNHPTKAGESKFPMNYINHIKSNINFVDIILVSSHDVVRKALRDNNIEYILVYPDRSLKEEYLRRYKDRGTPEDLIDKISNNWDSFIDSCEKDISVIKLKLTDPSQYLSDAIYHYNRFLSRNKI